MDNLTELKALWHTTNTDHLPDASQMLREVKKFRGQRLRKKWMAIASGVLLTLLMIVVLISGQFKLISSYIGGALIAASSLLLVVNNIRSLKRFNQLEDCNNKEFLDFLEQTRLNQIYFYKRTQVVMMMLCSVGLLVYLYEPATRNLVATLAVLTGTVAWLLVCWLVIRPRVFRRNQEKLNELRSRIEQIANQLK
ncbi:MAG TPA: hypothetical protein VGE15_04880 [Sphingobacteriaceae bacterium]